MNLTIIENISLSMHDVIHTLRIPQWLKQVFVAAPLVFSGHLCYINDAAATFIGMVAFCLASSAIYCLNDLADRRFDRLHPLKRQRPIAAGRISTLQAVLLAVLLLAGAGLCLCGSAQLRGGLPWLAVYLVLNAFYTLWGKRIPLWDVVIVALCFVLRVVYGAALINVAPSSWIMLMTFLLAMVLALSKRRDDFVKWQQSGEVVRPGIQHYSLAFIDTVLSILTSVAVICYVMYCMEDEVMLRFHSPYIYTTAVFVLVGMLRYLQLTIVQSASVSPTKVLLTDRFLQVTVTLWLLDFIYIIYA